MELEMKPPTAAERRHMARVRRIGCIACLNKGIKTDERDTAIHHVRHNCGIQKRDHMKVIGLCFAHHQFHGQGVSIHDGLESWEAIHGTEADLLMQVEGMLT